MLGSLFVCVSAFAAVFVSAETSQPCLENLNKISDVLVKENLHIAVTDPADDDQCHQTYTDEDSCNADKNGIHPTGCNWCHCKALPSSCWTIENSKKLPAAVFQCDKTGEQEQQVAAKKKSDDEMYI